MVVVDGANALVSSTGDGGSGLGEVTWDWCRLRVRLGGKSEEQG